MSAELTKQEQDKMNTRAAMNAMSAGNLANLVAALDALEPDDGVCYLMSMAIDALFANAGGEAFAMLAELDVSAENPLVAAALDAWFTPPEAAPLTVAQVKAMFDAVDSTR